MTAKENSEWIAAQAIEQARKAGASEDELSRGVRLEAHELHLGPGGLPAYPVELAVEQEDGTIKWRQLEGMYFAPSWSQSPTNPDRTGEAHFVTRDPLGGVRPDHKLTDSPAPHYI